MRQSQRDGSMPELILLGRALCGYDIIDYEQGSGYGIGYVTPSSNFVNGKCKSKYLGQLLCLIWRQKFVFHCEGLHFAESGAVAMFSAHVPAAGTN